MMKYEKDSYQTKNKEAFIIIIMIAIVCFLVSVIQLRSQDGEIYNIESFSHIVTFCISFLHFLPLQ